ncbi:MAG TPA: hypothetical protein VF761_01945, partial [Gemmatimonadaceae bacterium]
TPVIATTDTLMAFNRMLAAAGFDMERPDAALAWRVFKEFAVTPVAAATDGLLFQCGTYDFSGEPAFEFDFTRQFTHEEEGEPAGMEQLSCTLYFPPTEERRALRTNLWSFGFASAAEFFAAVEALPEFRVVMAGPAPTRAATRQEEI